MTIVNPLDLDTVHLAKGAHESVEAGMCLLEAVAYVAGVGLGSVAVGCLIEKYAPNVSAKWLPEPSPDMVAWREKQSALTDRVHELKTERRFFDAIVSGIKTCEVRRDDRDFQTGDALLLKCLDPQPSLARQVYCTVTHVLRGGQYGIDPGFVVLSIKIGAAS